MNRFHFDVTRDAKRKRSERGKNLRLFLLFCLITAITAAVVYAIIPDEPETPDAAADQAPAPAETPVGEVSGAADAAASSAADRNEPAAAASGDAAGAADNSGSTAGTPSAADGDQTGSDQTAGTPSGKTENTAKYNPSSSELADHTRRTMLALADGSWQRADYAVSYTVRSGDRVVLLAQQFKTNSEFIRQYSNVGADNTIVPGQVLYFINAPGGWQLTVSRSQQTLQIDRLIDGQAVPFAIFPCQISNRGRSYQNLVVCQRRANPEYRDDQGRLFEHDADGNPYGDYRIVLAAAGNPDAPILHLSIHDAGDSNALAGVLRNGSMVLSARDIKLLYTLIPKGTAVRIVE